MTQTVTKDHVIFMHYTLTNDAGEELDSSVGAEPLFFLHGAGNIVEGLEEAIDGLTVGSKLQVTVPPEKGYGLKDEDGEQNFPRDMFPEEMPLEEGMFFVLEGPEGQLPVWLVAVEGDEVTLDTNHPLAGVTLNFAVEIVRIRKATAEELVHGHPHGAEGTEGHHH
ncbi:MAG: hypothetical protein AUK47_21275 [Deltaproteobacteria bacterium CG2_30_63_29]|nr:MAG: hypothetical protein AUK47_21275 [Deltaproteobacteria bacterium CG2_30_63_29]PJB36169.1 MAG: peptidylprolyl isomerase [Deltaproteobacteria bacterium CG_4_9_14_3_um_filter_63_12]